MRERERGDSDEKERGGENERGECVRERERWERMAVREKMIERERRWAKQRYT